MNITDDIINEQTVILEIECIVTIVRHIVINLLCS